MGRPRHPNKHIESALRFAEGRGWRVEKSNAHAHAWGRKLCPRQARDGCKKSVWSTPRNPQGHAQEIRKIVEQCPHHHEDQDED